jgi:circadian clock protein KaiC
MLAETPLRYRRQILALKRYFTVQRVTSLFIDDKTGARARPRASQQRARRVQSRHATPPFGATRRQLQVHKLRGRAFREGLHDFVIRHDGLASIRGWLPQSTSALRARFDRERHSPARQAAGGGIAKGTSTLVIGAAGTGKSSLAAQFVVAAAARGQHSADLHVRRKHRDVHRALDWALGSMSRRSCNRGS